MKGLERRPEVLRFVGVARKYCESLRVPSADRDAWLLGVLAALAGLYAAAFGLPDVEDVEVGDDDKVLPVNFDIGHEEWKQLWTQLGELLGSARYHWAYFDPTEPRGSKDEAIIHDLADDLADIDRNVRSGLKAWDTGEQGCLIHAIWTWRFQFEFHWGPHAVSALRALHQLAFSRGLGLDAQ